MKGFRWILLCWMVGLMACAGCAGSGEVIPLQIHPVPGKAETVSKPPAPLRVTIGPFEDRRTHKTGMGVRTHLWGGVSYFDVPGGKPADAAAQALADYLAAKGWQVMKPGSHDTADVVLTGRLHDCSVRAKSRVGFTAVSANTKLALQAQNVSDGSTVHMMLNGAGADDVFWFTPEDAQALLNDVLASSFDKLVEDTRRDNNSLRLKGP